METMAFPKKVVNMGGSLGVQIPKLVHESLGISKGDVVRVELLKMKRE